MKNRFKKTLVAVLSVLLSFSLACSSYAAGYGDILSGAAQGDWLRVFFSVLNMITTEDNGKDYVERPLEQIEYTEEELQQRNAIAALINNDLNRIKSQKPAFERVIQRGLPGSDKDQAMGVIDQISSIAGAIGDLLWGDEKNPLDISTMLSSLGITEFFSELTTSEHLSGVDCDGVVSVAGEDYVCALEGKDIYNDNPITKSRYDDSYTFRIYLQDAINPDENSTHAKVFDLFSDVKLYQTIASMVPELDVDIIKIRYVDCYLEGQVDEDGNIEEYTTHYKCILQIDTTQTGYDLSQYIDSINNTEIYESLVTYRDFNWTPRQFCDLNNDGRVSTADARYALQIAIGLEELQEDSILYGDVNGDQAITTTDARSILRIATLLDPMPQRPGDTAE